MTHEIPVNQPQSLPALLSACSSLKSLLEAQADQFGDCPAITGAGGFPLTYSALQAHAAATGAHLNSLGLGRADRIAVVLPNGPSMAAAFLSVAAAAVCAPLNPAYRSAEFDFFLADLDAKALIVQEYAETPAIAAAKKRGIPVLYLQPTLVAGIGSFTLGGDTKSERPVRSADCALPEDIALVLHTSGTTAQPKIVPLTHANLCASARAVAEVLALTSGDRCLNVMPLFHIHGLVGALLSSLFAGASVYCSAGFSAPEFFSSLKEAEASWYTAVPTMHQSILSRAALDGLTVDTLRAQVNLRLVRSSSAALPPPVMAALESLFGAPVLEAYGMTEAAHQMACNPLPPRSRKPGSVGLASGPEVAVMDGAGHFLPHGATGEVVIRGDNVTPGYEANPAANAAAFTEGWFRTGDQGYLDRDGYLFLTGRLKELINRGGEKIAPREIDEALLAHPSVAQAVAFAAPHERLGEEVMAAVVLHPGHSALEHRRQERELREFAAERLADFKVPARIVFLDEIPKGPTGKVQRIGLAERLSELLRSTADEPAVSVAVPVDTLLEASIIGLIEDVLGRRGIEREDDFFQSGGDSLLAVTLLTRLEKTLDVTLSLIRLFEVPTAAGMAGAIEEARGEVTLLLAEIEALSEDEAQHLLRPSQERI